MIDAHVHLWRLGRHGCRWPGPDEPALYRDFTLADLDAAVGALPVERIVLVQTQEDEADTRWLLSLSADPRIAGVVGWTDLGAGDVGARLRALADAGALVGIRPMVQDRDANWYDDPRCDAGYAALADRGLVLDALVRPRHLPALARLAARHPTLTIVVDHAAKPVNGVASADWLNGMKRLAALPNVACKLSGLVTELPGDRPPAIDHACLDVLTRGFGYHRLIFGSDWPVVTTRCTYAEWLAMAREAVPAAARAAVFGGNAARIYRLPAETAAAA